MADISKIKLPGNEQYDIKDSVARAGMTEFIEDTRTAAGAALTGVSASKSLYDGKHIIFFSKYALANNVTLTLTLANGTETAAVPVYYYGTTRMGTRYGANYVIPLTYYDEKWYADGDYDSNTTSISNLTHTYGGWIADRVVYRYQFLVTTDADHVSPFNVTSNGYNSSTKTILTDIEFDPFGRMFFYNTTTTGAAGAVLWGGAMLYAVGLFDLRYSFNIANATASGLVGNKDTYMKVIPQANGKVKLADAWPLTQTLPTTDDGYWYIHIGRQYDWYRVSLYPTHKILRHDGTKICFVNQYTDENYTSEEKTKLAGLPDVVRDYSRLSHSDGVLIAGGEVSSAQLGYQKEDGKIYMLRSTGHDVLKHTKIVYITVAKAKNATFDSDEIIYNTEVPLSDVIKGLTVPSSFAAMDQLFAQFSLTSGKLRSDATIVKLAGRVVGKYYYYLGYLSNSTTLELGDSGIILKYTGVGDGYD